jgi:hypothetical protein
MALHALPCVPGLIAGYFLSRRGQRSSYTRSATPQKLDLGHRLRTGHEHGGLTDATACSAAKHTATRYERIDGPAHRSFCQPKCASSSSRRSTAGNRSGRQSVI